MSVVLTEHLPLLATAPDGIQKLRGLILELAVRGKLVPQDPKDEPANELLKRIAQERARLEVDGACKKSKATPLVGEDEQPFKLPNGWTWGRIADVANSQAGFAFKSSAFNDAGIGLPLIRIRDVGFSCPTTFFDGPYRDEFVVTKGDYLVSMDGQFRVAVWKGTNALLNQRVSRLQFFGSEVAQSFFAISLHIRLAELQGVKAYTTVDHLSGGQISAAVVGIPPFAEQHRIVAKVDELMALCDRLEAEQGDAEAAHAKLVETLLDTLTQSTDAADLAANWQRLAEYFDTLFTTESGLDVLKQTILQLAVMGKLHEGTSDGWEAKRLDKVCSDIVDCPHSTPKWTATGKICVRTSQFKPGKLDLSDCRFVSESTFAERIARLKPAADDILYSREGGILGVACRVPPGAEICLGQRMMLLRPGSQIASAFLELVLNSPMITEIARQNTTGGAAPRVNVSTVKAYPIPVPPLSEQHRIVAKVDELMALCEQIKGELAESRSRQARLATTLIESALEAA